MLRRPPIQAVDSRVAVVRIHEFLNIDSSDVVAAIIITATRLTEKSCVKGLAYVNAKTGEGK
jgi:hypothetical protein